MPKYIQTGLILLLLVVLNATGDASRLLHWQMTAHVIQVVHLAGWIAIWALFDFKRYYVAMYILARVWAFDLVHNLWTGMKLLYMGENDPVGWLVIHFAELVKQDYINFSLVLKILAFIWWLAWLFTDGDMRAIYLGKRKA